MNVFKEDDVRFADGSCVRRVSLAVRAIAWVLRPIVEAYHVVNREGDQHKRKDGDMREAMAALSEAARKLTAN